VPSGRSRDRLPIGVQIVGRAWREDQAVAAAGSVETTPRRVAPAIHDGRVKLQALNSGLHPFGGICVREFWFPRIEKASTAGEHR
jgi:hypothetical protein